MTDLEMTRLCAEAMGYVEDVEASPLFLGIAIRDDELGDWYQYDPLHDDAQAMALVKKMNAFGFGFAANDSYEYRWFCMSSQGDVYESVSADLNRAIVECVAKMHKASRNDKVESK